MKTLIATDGSAYATTALTAAGALLKRTGNTFELTCIIPDFSFSAGLAKRTPHVAADLRSKYQLEMERKTRRVLEDARRMLHEAGIPSHTFTETGSPGDVLVRLAADYDSVVVGSQSGSERPSPGLGPVASRIVEHVSGIVLVGRRILNEKNLRILIGVDGSASSENAVDTLAASFNIGDAEVTVMHVVEKPWLRLALEPDWYPGLDLEGSHGPSDQPEAERLFGKELRSEAELIVKDARSRLSRHCLSVETQIAEGNPANEFLEQLEVGEYDLAVLGATGASDLKHTLLGSVSFKVASYAPCSVAVIR